MGRLPSPVFSPSSCGLSFLGVDSTVTSSDDVFCGEPPQTVALGLCWAPLRCSGTIAGPG